MKTFVIALSLLTPLAGMASAQTQQETPAVNFDAWDEAAEAATQVTQCAEYDQAGNCIVAVTTVARPL